MPIKTKPKTKPRRSGITVSQMGEECQTCLGSGRIRDGETGELRRCLDCGGAG